MVQLKKSSNLNILLWKICLGTCGQFPNHDTIQHVHTTLLKSSFFKLLILNMWKCIISKQITIGLQHTLKIPRKAISDNDLNGKPVKQASTTAHALYKIILITCHDVCSACHNNTFTNCSYQICRWQKGANFSKLLYLKS